MFLLDRIEAEAWPKRSLLGVEHSGVGQAHDGQPTPTAQLYARIAMIDKLYWTVYVSAQCMCAGS